MKRDEPGDDGRENAEEPAPKRSSWRLIAPLFAKQLNLVHQFLGQIIGAVLLGVVIDYVFKTSPWGTVGVASVGIGLALVGLVQRLK